MEKYICDKRNGLWYELQGEYYIPCVVLSETESQPIGVWGRRHLRYMKEHRPVLYATLLLSGELSSHLAEVDERASAMLERLMGQMAAQQGISEQMKVEDQMAWVRSMSNIRNAAEEIVNAEVTFA